MEIQPAATRRGGLWTEQSPGVLYSRGSEQEPSLGLAAAGSPQPGDPAEGLWEPASMSSCSLAYPNFLHSHLQYDLQSPSLLSST